MSRRWLLLLLLLWAAVLRFVGLVNGSPPGLSHDEVANWLIDRSILAGRHAVYFTEAYGHEAGFHYWQALLVGLLGDHALALRLATAFLGVLVVAVTYTLSNKLFNRHIALLATAVSATNFWPVFFSRQGLRAMMLPFTAGLAIYFLHRCLFSSSNKQPMANQTKVWGPRSVVSGPSSLVSGLLFTALSTYTYMASRALPFLLGGWAIYVALFHRRTVNLSKKWRGLLLFFVLYGILAWPLVAAIQNAPEAEARISEVDGPLRALLSGDVGPVMRNAVSIAEAFGWSGDPLWRQNVAGMPIFAWPMAILFYGGMGIALWRWRDPRYGLLLLWTAAAALPSLLTVDAPSTIRMILLLPILGLFPAIVIHNLSTLSTVFPQLSTVFPKNLGITVLTIVLALFSSGRTIRNLGVVWPANDEVAFVWQRDLTAAAAWLDREPAVTEATIVGWTPETMDEPTMAVTLKRDDLNLRFTGRVGEVTTAVLPGGDPTKAVLLRPAVLPFDPVLEEALVRHGVRSEMVDGVAVYRWSEPFDPQPAVNQPLVFSDQLMLVGFDKVGGCRSAAGGSCQIVTYWHIVAPVTDERRFFLHIISGEGEIVAQSDVLDAPARFWQPGDWLVQVHTLPTTAEDVSFLLGVYDPRPPFARLSSEEGEEGIELIIIN